MKKLIIAILAAVCALAPALAKEKTYEVCSPNGALKTSVTVVNGVITYSVSRDGAVVLSNCEAGLEISGKALGATVKGKNVKAVSEEVRPAVPLKFSVVGNKFNVMTLKFKENYSMEVRAYDDGMAYRFVMRMPGDIELTDENVTVRFAEDCMAHLQPVYGWRDSNEQNYIHTLCSEQNAASKMCNLPALFEVGARRVLMCETDVRDYSNMWLQGTGKPEMRAKFARTPLEEKESGDRSRDIVKEASYFTRTSGFRALPWRYFVVANNDAEIITSTMTTRLMGGSAIDASWIEPGQVSWDWWNGMAVYGPDVDFESGINTATYKYFIDFASRKGIKYVILDEGWSRSTYDVFQGADGLDLEELVNYGKQKGVGLILWLTWTSVDLNFDVIFKHYADMGVKGFKIDFMDRGDQWMVNYYERVTKEAAKHKLLIDFHGAYKPGGLEQLYPNLISYEGVRGMEQCGNCLPKNSVYLPFMRNVAGAMDYTPGSMQSVQPEAYGSQRPQPQSPGTRAYQLALFVIFESGLQMLGDSPTQYMLNPEATEFIVGVPTTWDETVVLDAKLGEYVVVAKRKGEKWWIGGMNGTDKPCTVTVNMDKILRTKRVHRAKTFTDGPNAGRLALDCRISETQIANGDFTITMARNGGFAAVVE